MDKEKLKKMAKAKKLSDKINNKKEKSSPDSNVYEQFLLDGKAELQESDKELEFNDKKSKE